MPRRPDMKDKGKDAGDQKIEGMLPRRSTRRQFQDVEGTGASVPREAQSKRMQIAIQGAESTLKELGDNSQKDPMSGDLTPLSSDKGNDPSQISDEQAIAKLSLKYIQEKGKEALLAHIDKTKPVEFERNLAKTQLDYIFSLIYGNLVNKTGKTRINAINEYLNKKGSPECLIFERLVRKKKEELAKEPPKRQEEDTAGPSTKTIEQMQESDTRAVSHLTEEQVAYLSEMHDTIYKKSRGMPNPEIYNYYRKITECLYCAIEGKWVEGSEAPKDPTEALLQVPKLLERPPSGMKDVTVKLLEKYADEIKDWMTE